MFPQSMDDYRAFAKWDIDQSQSVDFEEFLAIQPKEYMYKYGREEMKKWFDAIDLNGNGEIDFNEFRTMRKRDLGIVDEPAPAPAPPPKRAPTADDYREFAKWDTDQSQAIEFEEFLGMQSQEICWQYSKEHIRSWFDAADADGDGVLNFNEFFALIGPNQRYVCGPTGCEFK
mmetsp:Transcript_543/g.1108  ORF Transcript_543/g.1108 Transcript_543/m.1108 type:complete len:173 (-) Transcript_543:281-799(-)|eukprot:CAMPEP_0183336244 /NCGR_PEP_ID=MMETSP0164_2-20130417/4280_1 /TAXON_ID=221442 /ORGANISM="Coccolithus pelagicus ssp braarudi, Strain PLY182g" /LENGTH=172 /DNA_ID=CAMNT_0025505727 /DNA_START=120 /DNA_END=638 /DNA_ORIENTATION=+